MCRADLSLRFSVLAQATSLTPKHEKLLNAAVAIAMSSKVQGLRFVLLNPETVHLGLFIYARFASNADSSSQLGFL